MAGEYDREIAKQRKVIEQDPTNLDAAYTLGNYLAWDGQFDDAVAVYEGILKKEPKYEDAAIGIARALSWKGDLAAAAAKNQEILAKNPRSWEAYQGLGNLALWQNDFEKGIGYFQKALALNAWDSISLRGIGRASLAKGDLKRAERYLRRADIIDYLRKPLKLVAGLALGLLIIFLLIRRSRRRRRETLLQLELRLIRFAVTVFHLKSGTYPIALEKLADETWRVPGDSRERKLLEGLRRQERGYFADPFGKRYWYNADNGAVHSTTKGYEEW